MISLRRMALGGTLALTLGAALALATYAAIAGEYLYGTAFSTLDGEFFLGYLGFLISPLLAGAVSFLFFLAWYALTPRSSRPSLVWGLLAATIVCAGSAAVTYLIAAWSPFSL